MVCFNPHCLSPVSATGCDGGAVGGWGFQSSLALSRQRNSCIVRYLLHACDVSILAGSLKPAQPLSKNVVHEDAQVVSILTRSLKPVQPQASSWQCEPRHVSILTGALKPAQPLCLMDALHNCCADPTSAMLILSSSLYIIVPYTPQFPWPPMRYENLVLSFSAQLMHTLPPGHSSLYS